MEPTYKKYLFIYYSDFAHIIDSVRSVYPITDPETNETDEEFSIFSRNWIHNKAWNEIIAELQSKELECAELKDFIDRFCFWVAESQIDSDEIMVDSTI